MKKIVLGLWILVSVCAYAQDGPASFAELKEYVATQRPLMDSGQLLASTYYKGLYSRFLALNAPAEQLERGARLIRYSEMYETGSIDKSEFEYRRRLILAEEKSAIQSAERAAQAQERINEQQEAERKQQNTNALLSTAAQLLQASGPHTLAPTVSPQASPPGVVAGFLQSQSVNGFLRYCRYSNGIVNTISVTTLCPLSTQ